MTKNKDLPRENLRVVLREANGKRTKPRFLWSKMTGETIIVCTRDWRRKYLKQTE